MPYSDMVVWGRLLYLIKILKKVLTFENKYGIIYTQRLRKPNNKKGR